ncbi:NAD-dependent epimerase/dehydratase family protein [Sphingomonas solaris]|uniref:NAD-dependent epimerase/dehydratase family protein n=1 Tax=Alterirhizorhabdus solaris TaxID=2529389 RepID=A0A558QXA8_9SPHN|nr:NAD-dependent epimerase/dehydratase family protein [Sphingomonas solaris]TVV71697.1 NAD-dependent epimerase/dehydratase family protein [Sphingomonas solaris]
MAVIGVFGANGFIGRAVVRFLLARGQRVVALGRAFPPDYASIVGGTVETRVVDFNDTLSVHATLQGIDQAIDLVNSSSPALGNGRVVEDAATNVLPHISFVQSCILSGVSRIVFMSSGGTVYGRPDYLPLDEDHPTYPLVSYGAAKLMVEHYLRMLTRDSAVDHVILRVSNPFGPGQVLRKGQGLIASILERQAAGLPIVIYGDGQAQRDYLYVDDLCHALLAALDAPPMRETFNIGTGHGRSTLDVIRAVEAVVGHAFDISFVNDRPTDARSNILDCGKATRLLHWTAQTPFDEGIRRTVAAASRPPQ